MIIIVGESETTNIAVAKQLSKIYDCEWIVPYTTRPPKSYEIDGEGYIFTSELAFKGMTKHNDFYHIELKEGYKYGYPYVNPEIENCVLVTTPSSMRFYHNIMHEVTSVYLFLPYKTALLQAVEKLSEFPTSQEIGEIFSDVMMLKGQYDGVENETDIFVDLRDNFSPKEIADMIMELKEDL